VYLPDDVTRTGYTLAEWNTKSDGTGTGYTPGSYFWPDGNTRLYAKWTVYFEPNMPSGWWYLQTALLSNDKGFMNFDASWWGSYIGNRALLWGKETGKHFSWRFERVSTGLFKVVNGSGFVLDIEGSNFVNNKKVEAWEDNGTDAQRFRFQKIDGDLYKIFTVNDSITLHVSNGSTSDGTHIVA